MATVPDSPATVCEKPKKTTMEVDPQRPAMAPERSKPVEAVSVANE
jgi:hypothetical protein